VNDYDRHTFDRIELDLALKRHRFDAGVQRTQLQPLALTHRPL
jgi:hypothetical protein